jgi:hypothetical protein
MVDLRFGFKALAFRNFLDPSSGFSNGEKTVELHQGALPPA